METKEKEKKEKGIIINLKDTKELGKAAVETGTDAVGTALGFITAHGVLKMIKKQDSPIVNATTMAAGLGGAVVFKHKLIKAICLGVGIYGGINLLGQGFNKVTEPGTKGIAGILPEAVKEKIRGFIPVLSGNAELMGENNFSNLPSMDDAAKNNGVGEYVPYTEIKGVSGLGNAADLM